MSWPQAGYLVYVLIDPRDRLERPPHFSEVIDEETLIHEYE